MDFSWQPEQLALRDDLCAFAAEQLGHHRAELDQAGEFSHQDWQACAQRGILGLMVPEKLGGAGLDILSVLLAMEGLGHGCRDYGLCLALNAQMWTVQLAIQQFGSEAQQRALLPGLIGGQTIAAQAITEPEAGSDVFALTSRAEKTEHGYRLNGHKIYSTLAPVADLFLVFATVNPDAGRWGVTAFLIDRDTPGLTIGPTRQKMGLRTVPFGDLELHDCDIPEHRRLGPEGSGVSLFNASLEWERSCMLASQIGAMQRQLELSIEHVRERRQFGQPIASFQSVSNRIADMQLRLETSRLLLYKIGWEKQQGRSAPLLAAMAKLQVAEAAVASAMDAVRVHGTAGYLSDGEIEHGLRDAVGSTLYGGTSDIQRNIIARLLGL